MRPKSFGRVVPLLDDVALFVELLRDDVDVAGLDVDLDERLFGRVGHALVRGDQRVRERLEHDLDGDPLLALDRVERLHHLGVHGRSTPLGRARVRRGFVPLGYSCVCFLLGAAGLGALARLRRRAHSKTVRACRSRRTRSARSPSSSWMVMPSASAAVMTPRRRSIAPSAPRAFTDTSVPMAPAKCSGRAQRALQAGAADLEGVRSPGATAALLERPARRRRLASSRVSMSTPPGRSRIEPAGSPAGEHEVVELEAERVRPPAPPRLGWTPAGQAPRSPPPRAPREVNKQRGPRPTLAWPTRGQLASVREPDAGYQSDTGFPMPIAGHGPGDGPRDRYRQTAMAASPFVELEVAGHTVQVTNPDKVFFPARGETKLDLAAVLHRGRRGRAARGARAADRPQALPRTARPRSRSSRSGCPPQRPEWIETVAGHVPERAARRRALPGRRRPHRLGRQPRLPRPQPVGGAPGRRRPPRRAAGRPRPAAGRRRTTTSARSPRRSTRCSTSTASSGTRRPRDPAAST